MPLYHLKDNDLCKNLELPGKKLFDKFFLGPELFIQQYSYKYPNTEISNASGEDKNTEANLLISFVNELSKPSKGSTFLTGGLGQNRYRE